MAHEEEILRNPYSVKHWIRYIDHLKNEKKHKKEPQKLIFVYERALKELPGSYKLWHAYLLFRKKLIAKAKEEDLLRVREVCEADLFVCD